MIAVLTFLLGLFSFFQTQSFDLNYFDTQSGLSNNIVYDVYQDHQGFVWIATDNGLNRFDAYNFKHFQHSLDDSTSLSSNIIRKILEDNNGDLWIGTREGLNLFDRKSESFSHYEIPGSFNLFLNDIQFIQKDSKGFFWFLIGESLFNFDPKSKVYTQVKSENSLDSFAIDSKDTVWVLTSNNGLRSYSSTTKKWNEHTSITINKGSSIFSSSDRSKVFATFRNKNASLRGFAAVPDLPGESRAERLLEDSKGNTWIGTINGLFIKRKGEEEVQEYKLGRNTTTLSRNIKSIFEDKAGGIWIGTVNGLFLLDPQKKPFNTIQGIESDQIVMAIEESQNGFWVNYFSEALKYYEFTEDREPIVRKEVTLNGKQNQIWDIESSKVDKSELWLATEDGLIIYDQSLNQIEEVKLPKESIRSRVIFTINTGEKGTYWLGGYERIYQVDAKSKEVLQTIQFPLQYVGVLIQDILETEKGLLIATEGYGLLTYSSSTGIENYDLKGISSIWDIYESPDKEIWLGTNKGLYWVAEDITTLGGGSTFGLESAIVFSITEDHEGVLWLGTDKGLVRFSNGLESFIYSTKDGILNPEFNRRSIFTSKNDYIFSGGMGGVTYFDPSKIRENPNIPNVLITDFKVISADSSFSISTLSQETIVLDWNQNTFEIGFTSLNYTNPSQNQYQYALMNHDPELVHSKGSRIARYVRVPSGEYEFVLKGSNNDQVWNERWATIRVKINPPFWDTIWFKLLVITCFIFLIWQVYRYRVRKLLEIERVRLRIASDLHDEIGSGLSGIALAGDLFNQESSSGNPRPELANRIANNARTLASSLDSIVWLIDPSKESMLDFLQKCKRISQELLASKEVKTVDKIPEVDHNLSISSLKRRNMYLIFKEVLHNTLKHSNSSAVEIRFDMVDGWFQIRIQDYGQGFNEQEINKGNGLDSIRRRADEIKSILEIASGNEEGTKTTLKTRLP